MGGLIAGSPAGRRVVLFRTGGVYQQVLPRFGGGLSPQVTILLERDLPIAKSSQPLRVFLLDENERGFYILRSRSSKQAIWLPRESVASVIHEGSTSVSSAN
jgi:hypothetical protein